MYETPKQIIVLFTMGNEQKTVSLVQKSDFSSIYDIILDKEYQGQIQRGGKGWTVNTLPESCIQRENYQPLVDAINQAVSK